MTGGPLRVLTIGHSYVVGTNRSLAREVARDPAFDVTVAGPSSFHGSLRPLRLDPEPADSRLRLVGLEARWTRSVHLFRYDRAALRELVRRGGFDVVHAWEEPYVYAGYSVARAMRGSRARFCFRTAQSLNKRYPPPFNVFERKTLRRSHGWIAGGHLVHRAMLERGYPAAKGRVLTLAVDTELFRPQPEEVRRAVIDELGLAPPVLGFLGRLTREKGVDLLLAALERLPVRSPWSLLLLGSGPYAETALRWARERGVDDRVRVHLARHEEVPRYLSAVDLLLAPSRTTRRWKEQFGRMIIEGFACGVPVVGSDSGEIPFVVGEAGRLVPDGDVEAWSQAIEELLGDEGRRREMARLGLERVRRFSVRDVAAGYREFYRWLARQPLAACGEP